ncbi:serine threonine protein partial : Serine/threonine protein kinase OS=Planctomyces maris DSM 8797 GN=PM8797T_06517 PE=4 SV=1: Pkinase: LRR_5 [Gemmataceae bacterium]|nr:serine threonine protein partial : Serine/threonine protein kinase OS=Planctomyces maris DSM 8797 GN=PM8797T_06517 PE=4 SV=1: Pkinase: LRR_5 [Gemmataceae bacterium]VTU00423.1 serine threonine protein partial : Serine/threonine protein kinase OS=Planctomyces maris DSM 8797 GN=PM8797T_06517 PE=4 SV=1: Pkinase: LRR_5 [Gemmataceae bacterium]
MPKPGDSQPTMPFAPASPGTPPGGDTVAQYGPPRAVTSELPALGQPAAPDELGRLGKYRLQRELGRGGMGAVFLAFDERLQRKVALKVMLPEAAADATAKERFLREARAAARVSSDHVVGIFEADETDGTPYIALQYLQGYPLDEYLAKYGLPTVPQAVRIGQEAALGLDAAHQLGLIHRDIKPANVWLESPNGRVKLLDFGLARQRDESVNLTGKGLVVGTPAYMSPEQARGLPLDARSDLFSLGVVLYQLCTGRMPFTGDTPMAVLTALAVDHPVPVRQWNPRTPEPLAALVHRLLAKRPAARPPTAAAVAEELKAIFGAMQSPAAATGQPQVVYVPMAITNYEPNPFEHITQSGTVSGELATEVMPEGARPPKSPRPQPAAAFPKVLAGAIAFAVLTLALAAFLLTSGSKPDAPPPDDAAVAPPLTKPVKVTPATPKKDGERVAAEYALSVGAVIYITPGEEVRIIATLPQRPFAVTLIDFLGNTQAIDDKGFAAFEGCREVRTLILNRVPVGEAGLAHFKNCKAIQHLNLSEMPRLTDAGLAHFKGCDDLRRLDMGDVKVTDKGLAAFADCARLVELFLPHCPNVGDGALACFQKCEGLRELRLDHTALTNNGLGEIARFKELIGLDVRNTRVTPEGVAALQKALPRCKIASDAEPGK